ncbi:hypothetical protein V6N12_067933 [Hibiscus sabdariffa]|uniref:Uncharacterized protein n=1 Tax=Hibiscus sabdariffa TaxID=183260 RepID=A0ABR2FNK5_9ROSI
MHVFSDADSILLIFDAIVVGGSDLSSSFRALNHQCNLIRVRIYALESYLQEVQQPLITCTLRDQGLDEGFSCPFLRNHRAKPIPLAWTVFTLRS